MIKIEVLSGLQVEALIMDEMSENINKIFERLDKALEDYLSLVVELAAGRALISDRDFPSYERLANERLVEVTSEIDEYAGAWELTFPVRFYYAEYGMIRPIQTLRDVQGLMISMLGSGGDVDHGALINSIRDNLVGQKDSLRVQIEAECHSAYSR